MIEMDKVYISFENDEMESIYRPFHEMDSWMWDDLVWEEDSVIGFYNIINNPDEFTPNDVAVAEIAMDYLTNLIEETDYRDVEFYKLMDTKFYMTYSKKELSTLRQKVADAMCGYPYDEEEQDRLRKIIKLIDNEQVSRLVR